MTLLHLCYTIYIPIQYGSITYLKYLDFLQSQVHYSFLFQQEMSSTINIAIKWVWFHINMFSAWLLITGICQNTMRVIFDFVDCFSCSFRSGIGMNSHAQTTVNRHWQIRTNTGSYIHLMTDFIFFVVLFPWVAWQLYLTFIR